ncbi:MAG TPA: histidine kinase [Gemmatimonadaceae bacterium]|nr:histidine kinase [Gemmatimonadaceae bacterium]
MSRRLVWLQLLIGWFPVWALFATIIYTVHVGTPASEAMFISFRMIVAAALLGLGVQRIAERVPWPEIVRPGFVLLHFAAAVLYSIAWILLNSTIESAIHGAVMIVVGVGIRSFLLVGIWLYVMVAGVCYTLQSNARAANAETAAATAQLYALRSQLNPHFLFNALHTVVQLIPREPKVAAQAAEQVAGLLRDTLDEDRDIISVQREIDFVRRYLDVERIRFSDRLNVSINVPADVESSTVPSFSVQTLVENAVRHGAAPKVERTDLTIDAGLSAGELIVSVTDTGAGFDTGDKTPGTGLRRLRERLNALYGGRARLTISSEPNAGTNAVLAIPQDE